MGEHRKARRYEVYLPVQVCMSKHRPLEYYTGQLRDVSRTGIFFHSDVPIESGTGLELTFSLRRASLPLLLSHVAHGPSFCDRAAVNVPKPGSSLQRSPAFPFSTRARSRIQNPPRTMQHTIPIQFFSTSKCVRPPSDPSKTPRLSLARSRTPRRFRSAYPTARTQPRRAARTTPSPSHPHGLP